MVLRFSKHHRPNEPNRAVSRRIQGWTLVLLEDTPKRNICRYDQYCVWLKKWVNCLHFESKAYPWPTLRLLGAGSEAAQHTQ